MKTNNHAGQSIVEILLAIGLMAIMIPALLNAFVAAREGKPQRNNRIKASLLLRETEEALRTIRETDWNTFYSYADGLTHHPEISGGNWILVSGTEPIEDIFTRSVVLSPVQRDINWDIVTSGGKTDPSTVEAKVTVSWTKPIPSSVESKTYLTRYVNNTSWVQTSESDFNSGTITNADVENTGGGEVVLARGAGGSWAAPFLEDTYDSSGPEDGLDVFVSGNYAYVGLQNGVGNDDFIIIDISTPSSITKSGGLDLSTDVYCVYVSGNYAYLGTSDTKEELKIVNISNKSAPTKVGGLNLQGNLGVLSIFVSGNYAYMGKAASGGKVNYEFYVANISTPASPVEMGTLEYGADINGISVLGNYAYVASDNDNYELGIINVTNPNSPAGVGGYDANSGANGEDVFIEGNYVYLVTEENTNPNTDPQTGVEFYILDITTPTSPSFVGSNELGGNAKGVYTIGDYAFLATEVTGEEFTVLDISTKSSPSPYGVYNLGDNGNKLMAIGDYAYVSTDNDTSELAILSGGSGLPYLTAGTYESQTFNTVKNVGFNYVTSSVSEPSGTDIVFQIAVSETNPPTAFVGPDGTSGTFFELEGTIPIDYILGRYFRFKVFLSGDGTETPILEEIVVNYSP